MGHILCPWARHLGATVIGTVSTDAKAEIARNLGCHHVINYSTEDFVAVTRKITDGKGVDVVYESIGKDTLQRSLDCLRLVGMCAAYGQASGVPDPINLIEDLGVRGSLIITRPALSHYMCLGDVGSFGPSESISARFAGRGRRRPMKRGFGD